MPCVPQVQVDRNMGKYGVDNGLFMSKLSIKLTKLMTIMLMKQSRILFNWLTACGLALAMVATAAAQTVKQRTAEVVRIKGSARYSTGNNVWQPLKVGAQLRAGTIVQTAADSAVDIVFSEVGGPARRPSAGEFINYNPTVSQDIIRVQPDSVLAIDKVTVTETGADKVTDTELDLRSGRVIGSVRKVSAASTFEVKIPNGVAGIRGTLFSISALGVIAVIEGSVAVAIQTPQGPKVEVIQAGFEYDIRTGEIRETHETFAPLTYAPGQPEIVVPAPFSYVSPVTGIPQGDTGPGPF